VITARELIAMIAERGVMRSDELGKATKLSRIAVREELAPHVAAGAIGARLVRHPDSGRNVIEYRRYSHRVGAITRDLPLPKSKNGDGELRAALEEMQIKDSRTVSYSKTAVYQMADKVGVKVSTRPEGEQTRVWRTG